MQPETADEQPQPYDNSNSNNNNNNNNPSLKFPVLPGNDNVDTLLEHPRLLPGQDRPCSMALHHDDSSVDESLSSMGESAWDVVDEASAASDDDARNISRQPTPFSENPEQVHFDGGSIAGNDTSSESQGLRSGSRMIEFSHSRKDSSSDPPDTAKQPAPGRKSLFQPSSGVGQQDEGIPYIKFRESELGESSTLSTQQVSSVLTEFEGRLREKLLKEYKLDSKLELAGTVRQSMKRNGLVLDGAFKVLYVGPTEMKDAVVQKIASALAANHSYSPRGSLNSSRVTVVPISSFADDSSPDVVLIDSMGLDMNIEECKLARLVLTDGRSESIELKLTNRNTIMSSWNSQSGAYQISPDYMPPDLAAVYIPSLESASAKRSREQAQAFFSRHEIPALVVTFDTKWKKILPSMKIDPRLPHLCIESFDPESGTANVLDRRPVDINTFSNLDSAQLSRSLALLAPEPVLTPLSESDYFSRDSGSKSQVLSGNELVKTRRAKSWLERVRPFLVLLLASAAIYAQLLYYYGPGLTLTAPASLSKGGVIPHERPVPSLSTTTNVPSPIPASACEPALTPVVVAERHDASLATLLQNKFEPNKTDTFQVQVVGDNHVVLRPPTWFRQLKRAPTLQFKVSRENKQLDYEFSTLFDGVYALKLLPEEAHGVLNLSVWTNRKPRLNGTFQVEFGTPWLKVSGWQKAAQAMTEQVREELVAAQTGLFRAYVHANKRVQFFFKDAVVRADTMLKEAEKFGLASLASTIKSTEQMVTQSKALSATLSQRIMNGSEKTSKVLSQQRQTLAKDISNYTHKISAMFFQQAKALTEATSGLNIVSLGEEIQNYRENHFREAQKRMLHAWWKVRGAPQIKAKAQRQAQLRVNNIRRRSAPLRRWDAYLDEDY
ncbi:MAG: hypothetical protein LQ340_001031 [Diploschistes diacapsis]|nr:MAG: hypothetical protein LQ340_001031 [Diploschistes diacapsis]